MERIGSVPEEVNSGQLTFALQAAGEPSGQCWPQNGHL